MLDVGWPDPAAVLDRIESTRSCWASSWTSSNVCTVIAHSLSRPTAGTRYPAPLRAKHMSPIAC